jgi:hypothetical protein
MDATPIKLTKFPMILPIAVEHGIDPIRWAWSR